MSELNLEYLDDKFQNHLDHIIRLVDELDKMEWSSLSSTGKETMIEIQKFLGMPINKEKS